MSLLSHHLHSAARYMAKPKLLALRRQGVLPDLFEKLDQPWFRALKIETVLDIGAYTGRFAATIHALLPQAQIYAFEPLQDCFAELQKRRKRIPTLTPFNLALGDTPGEATFERNAFAPSSSFLKIADLHKTAFPNTRDTKRVTVRTERLDTVVANLTIQSPLLAKIDVQGFEERVLRGGEATIRRAQLIIVETSFTTLYEEQPLFNSIYNKLTTWGYTYHGALDQLYSPHSGQPLQEDSIFQKS